MGQVNFKGKWDAVLYRKSSLRHCWQDREKVSEGLLVLRGVFAGIVS